MITHDRYFLDRVANRICELDRSHLYFYDENYSGYLRRKAERELSAQAAERKRQSLLQAGAGVDSARGAGTRHQEPRPHRAV